MLALLVLLVAALRPAPGAPAVALPPPSPATTPAPAAAPAAPAAAPAPDVLATGLTESNAQLLWNPAAAAAPAGFALWRERLTALRPTYIRLVLDWSKLQPQADGPVSLDAPVDGCLRGEPPCAPFAGLRDTFDAIASQQHAAPGTFQPVVTVLGVPDWAARRTPGCERRDAHDRSRPISAAGLAAYGRLVAAVLQAAAAAGVEVPWWSPWNEANHPAFVSPQRSRCDARAPSRAAAVYAQLARAAKAALDAAPGDQGLLLGELAGYTAATPRTTGVAEFVRDLPDDVACLSRTWAQHAYTEVSAEAQDPVAALEAALDERPCTSGAHIWVTETGAGGPTPGGERPEDAASLARACATQDALLRRWAQDPRVDAAFQYTFREDPAYPVGLADAGLTRTYPTYDLWKAWGATRTPADPAPPALPGCS